MTPSTLAEDIVSKLELSKATRILEPSFGTGSFLIPLIHRFMKIHSGTKVEKLKKTLSQNIFGVEIDAELYQKTLKRIKNEFGELPKEMNLVSNDFFRVEYFSNCFDLIVGNPPFGGSFDPLIEDDLDRRYGKWKSHKIKKETYSFFISKCLDMLSENGSLVFISSDTFMTIKTMDGLRRKLLDICSVDIERLTYFSDETVQSTLILRANKTDKKRKIRVDGKIIGLDLIESTGNFSWNIDPDLAKYFTGKKLSDYVIATSGMTVGKNELFVREIIDGKIVEPFDFSFQDELITVKRELQKARLNKLSPKMLEKFRELEIQGARRRNLIATEKVDGPEEITLPHPDYFPYNKARSEIFYAEPSHVIFWKDQGDAVLTFKKNGNWYLHGVGGQKFFYREGFTWSLISSKLNVRYLPEGYVLDSGAPCAFLLEKVNKDELWFILGWCLTNKASEILKTVINHTRNIQSKDLERLPYPFWVSASDKKRCVKKVKHLVDKGMLGESFNRRSPEISKLDGLYEFG